MLGSRACSCAHRRIISSHRRGSAAGAHAVWILWQCVDLNIFTGNQQLTLAFVSALEVLDKMSRGCIQFCSTTYQKMFYSLYLICSFLNMYTSWNFLIRLCSQYTRIVTEPIDGGKASISGRIILLVTLVYPSKLQIIYSCVQYLLISRQSFCFESFF